MFVDPIIACGWCGGTIEIFLGTIMLGITGFVWPEVKQLLGVHCRKCSCSPKSIDADQ